MKTVEELEKQLLYWRGVVRGCRAELHEANRISDDEYAQLVMDHDAQDFVEECDVARQKVKQIREYCEGDIMGNRQDITNILNIIKNP